ncbi:cupin-like domain-containing protein [Rhizobacter sp. P5_C2]
MSSLKAPAHDETTSAVLQILDASKSNKTWFDSRGLIAGYHTVSIGGESFQGQRDSAKRVAKIPYDFSGKRVLDIGCSNGGLLHHLSGAIRFGVGVDFNTRCINGANAIKAANGTHNVHFYAFDLDKDDLSLLNSFVFGERVDVCFILNISLWVKRWKEVVNHCAALSDTLVFEAHGNAQQQAEQLRFVQSVYGQTQLLSQQSDDDPTYAQRSMYLCSDRTADEGSPDALAQAPVLGDGDEGAVRAAWRACFPNSLPGSVKVFPNTHESIVAEIDGDHIVKFPRAHRGATGIQVEQRITDFIRARVAVQVPKIELHSRPVALARYPKLDGTGFDRNAWAKLTDAKKDALAAQLAAFMLALHAVPAAEIERADLTFAPSWELSADLIETQLAGSEHPVLRKLVPEVVRNHRNLKVPAKQLVLGHFDLHGGNLLLDAAQERLLGVIDFGNCKRGDLHQDFSPLCLSSPDLAERVMRAYEQQSGRKVNRLMVQHYATTFYLNLLAGLQRNGSTDKQAYWLGQLETWFNHLVMERAKARLASAKPVSTLPPSWRQWVASNLMKGSEASTLQGILRRNGFADIESAVELAHAQADPYVEAGREIFKTLDKRNWLLKTCDTLAALDERYATAVERRAAPAFDVFVREYYSKHLPVLLTGGIDHWAARSLWTPEYFAEKVGSTEIEVQHGRENDPLYERNSGQHKARMTMAEFVRKVRSVDASNDFYMTANNMKNSLAGLEPLFADAGDFAQGYRDEKAPGNGQFLWFGPKGTFTPLHHDLTNNMLIQVYGRKKVTLIPALQTPHLYNDVGVFSAAAFPDFDAQRHPLMKNARPIEVEIGPGDALFIPVGWWHCVESLEVSIGLSFTNFKVTNAFSGDYPR